jgi:DNA-binding NarL/FixJ family response regulator
MEIIIVDDHVLFREGQVGLFMSQPDFEVVGQASTVQEAIDLAAELSPDLILMDFGLPDGTGLDATKAILAVKPDIKIVFLTVYEADENLIAAVRSGAKGYLLKNVPMTKLLAALHSVVRGEAALSRAMTSRIMAELTRTGYSTTANPAAFKKLSSREMEILRLIVTGASNREIASRLFIAENTVKHHVHNILKKLDVENRHQAEKFAKQNGLD